MSEGLSDQRPLWDAYGHAMGSAVGLELLMRIALINCAVLDLAKEGRIDDESRASALAKILRMTLGQTVSAFKRSFPSLAEDVDFCKSIDNAVESRNYLAHHYLEGILLGLWSAEGIELATLGCMEATEHFRSLENYVRDRCPVDFDAFFKLGEDKAYEFVENHPLRDKLRAIKEGKVPAE